MMIGFLILVAWVLFATVVLHQAWPALSRWAAGGEHEYADESRLGLHRHRQSDDTISVAFLVERCAAHA